LFVEGGLTHHLFPKDFTRVTKFQLLRSDSLSNRKGNRILIYADIKIARTE
jgi:hypothetical protein